MRSSIIIASALVVGAFARPQPHRRQPKIVYETEVVIQTVVVTVTRPYVETPGYGEATTMPSVETTLEPDEPTSTSAARSTTTTEPYETMPSVVTTEHLEPDEPTSTSAALSTTVKSTQTPTSSPQLSTSSSKIRATPAASPTPTPVYSPAPQPAASSDEHPSGSEQAYLTAGADYQAAIIYHHNAIRANHDAAPLTWDSDCEANARIAASRCDFKHFIPQGAGEGQNLFTKTGPEFNVTGGITGSWYLGELPAMRPWFGQPSIPHDVFEKAGHLTQLVWKGTTKVGCVSIDCGADMTLNDVASIMNKYTVCNYAPQGNVVGEFAKNVVPPKASAKAISWMD
jgi:uncharacterized protein YkwD